jgi:hypothetical protein
MSWVVVGVHMVTDTDGEQFETVYSSDRVQHDDRDAAIQHKALDSGDFLIAEVRGDDLIKMAWMREDRADRGECLDAASCLGYWYVGEG